MGNSYSSNFIDHYLQNSFQTMLLREMPQGAKGQDLEAELQAPALTWIKVAIAFTSIIYWASVWDFVHLTNSANIYWVTMLSHTLF